MQTKLTAVAGPVERGVGPGAEARWYCLSREGMATLCTDEEDAKIEATNAHQNYPLNGPFRAVQMVDAAEVERFRKAATRYYVIRQDHEGAVVPELALYAGRAPNDYIDAAIVSMGELGPNVKLTGTERIDGF